jgi:hypothetical protein
MTLAGVHPAGNHDFTMRPLAAIFLVIGFSLPLRADILANGNFTDGRAHWKGDAKEINTDDISSGNQPGVTVTLNKDKWTKIYQTFTTHENKVQYSITFTLSDDYQVDQERRDMDSGSVSGPSPGLDDIEGMYPLYLFSHRGGWTLIVQDFGAGGSSYIHPRPDPKKTDSQTLTGHIRGLSSNDEKILVLAFPPGEGTITLTNVSLAPDSE